MPRKDIGNSRCTRRDLLIAAGLGSILTDTSPLTGAGLLRKPTLGGTFLQPLNETRTWSREQWLGLFQQLARLRLSRLIIQWVESDGMKFYEAGTAPHLPVLQTILELAAQTKIQVMVGLLHDSAYWQAVGRDPGQVREYFAARESRTVSIINAVLPIVSAHHHFGGWFMTEEIDDINWQEPAPAAILQSYLHRVTGYLRLVTPEATIAISGFANSNSPPARLRSFWQELLGAVPAIGIVMFQDGIGARKLTLGQLPAYFASVRAATRYTGRRLWSVVEIFEQTAGTPLDTNPFAAVAAPFPRVLEQMQLGAGYASELIAFTAFDYMLSAATASARILQSSYSAYLDQ